jgi:hypothetical protein
VLAAAHQSSRLVLPLGVGWGLEGRWVWAAGCSAAGAALAAILILQSVQCAIFRFRFRLRLGWLLAAIFVFLVWRLGVWVCGWLLAATWPRPRPEFCKILFEIYEVGSK